MFELLIFALALLGAGVLGGLLAGLLGVGGGIVIVPVLFSILEAQGHTAALAIKIAVATSLATIVVTSLSSARSHHRHKAVDLSLLRSWAGPIVVGTFIGTYIAGQIDGRFLTLIFGVVALLVASDMILRRGSQPIWDGFPNGTARLGQAALLVCFLR